MRNYELKITNQKL